MWFAERSHNIYMMKFDEGIWVEQGSLALEIPANVLDDVCEKIKSLLKEAGEN